MKISGIIFLLWYFYFYWFSFFNISQWVESEEVGAAASEAPSCF